MVTSSGSCLSSALCPDQWKSYLALGHECHFPVAICQQYKMLQRMLIEWWIRKSPVISENTVLVKCVMVETNSGHIEQNCNLRMETR